MKNLITEAINGWYFYDMDLYIYAVNENKSAVKFMKDDLGLGDGNPIPEEIEKLDEVCFITPEKLEQVIIYNDDVVDDGNSILTYFINGHVIDEEFSGDTIPDVFLIDLDDEVHELRFV